MWVPFAIPAGPAARRPAFVALALLALAAVADASPKGPPQDSPYSLQTLAYRSLEPDRASLLPARDRAVEIRWVAREFPDLSAYQLTVEIEGSALSGTVARWIIEPGTGWPLDTEGRRAYRLGLPLRAEPGLAIHAALESVRADGRRQLLARLDDNPWERRGEACTARPAGPRVGPGRDDEGSGLASSPACLPESALRGDLAPSARPDAGSAAAASHRACRDLRDRGPPLPTDLLS